MLSMQLKPYNKVTIYNSIYRIDALYYYRFVREYTYYTRDLNIYASVYTFIHNSRPTSICARNHLFLIHSSLQFRQLIGSIDEKKKEKVQNQAYIFYGHILNSTKQSTYICYFLLPRRI